MGLDMVVVCDVVVHIYQGQLCYLDRCVLTTGFHLVQTSSFDLQETQSFQ